MQSTDHCRCHSGTRLGTNGSTSQSGQQGQGAQGMLVATEVTEVTVAVLVVPALTVVMTAVAAVVCLVGQVRASQTGVAPRAQPASPRCHWCCCLLIDAHERRLQWSDACARTAPLPPLPSPQGGRRGLGVLRRKM